MKEINVVRCGLIVVICGTALLAGAGTAQAQAQAQKPNILVIFGDDVGYWNVSAYNQGMIGYKTPNIDRIAKEGALFTLEHLASWMKPTSAPVPLVRQSRRAHGTQRDLCRASPYPVRSQFKVAS